MLTSDLITQANVPAEYTAEDVARRLACTLRNIRALDAGRVIPGRFTLGRLVRFRRAEVDSWIAAGCPMPRAEGAASA